MPLNQNIKLKLKDGSTVAVVGGGPAGSFFTWFILRYAQESGIKIHVDVFEPKNFNSTGPAGCNKCGGIVSESLIQMLSGEGIKVPPKVIRRGIDSYTLHLEHGKVVIEKPKPEQGIASIFRGLGPRGPIDSAQLSFDNFLLDLCREKGAMVRTDTIVKALRVEEGIKLSTSLSGDKVFDLVVGAVGLNAKGIEIFNSICPSYFPPSVTKTHIAEIFLGREVVDQYFGNSMHVFLLNLPNVKFGALIPKGNYVTMVLLGKNITREVVAGFLSSETVKSCFPPDTNISEITHCKCYPAINVGEAKSAFANRVVLIGDSASSKLYKNGLGAAWLTGQAAAKTAIFHGISQRDFQKWYQPVCTTLDNDNDIGKIIFNITSIMQKSSILKNGLLAMVVQEQKEPSHKRPMSSLLWDTFTGSNPYTSIFKRSLNPVFMVKFLWNIVKGQLIKKSRIQK
ncbi:MAG: hypothetical protein Q8M08_10810 [Bacteroidales bacterium]|nr:hypothetical protein [Bacteroidales bacterium]